MWDISTTICIDLKRVVMDRILYLSPCILIWRLIRIGFSQFYPPMVDLKLEYHPRHVGKTHLTQPCLPDSIQEIVCSWFVEQQVRCTGLNRKRRIMRPSDMWCSLDCEFQIFLWSEFQNIGFFLPPPENQNNLMIPP